MNKYSDIAEVIAFSALIAGVVVLEIHDKPAQGVWVLIVFWAFCFGGSKPSKD